MVCVVKMTSGRRIDKGVLCSRHQYLGRRTGSRAHCSALYCSVRVCIQVVLSRITTSLLEELVSQGYQVKGMCAGRCGRIHRLDFME
jgi:hypothetical protein